MSQKVYCATLYQYKTKELFTPPLRPKNTQISKFFILQDLNHIFPACPLSRL